MGLLSEKEFIENALKVMKFNTEEIKPDLVNFVNMREYKVATKEKPLLLTVGLQSCIALYAWEKNFSYLAHMNIYEGNWKDDFEVSEGNIPIRCKRIDDLYDEIIKHRSYINGIVNVGLILGVSPMDRNYKSRVVIEKDLLKLFGKLRNDGISASRFPDINSFSIILDSRNGQIIHGGEKHFTNLNIGNNKGKTDVKEK